jgi:hypothetical protein
VLSPTYAIAEFSTWTRRELVLADNLSKPIVPVTHTGTIARSALIFLETLSTIPEGADPFRLAEEGLPFGGLPPAVVAAQLAKRLSALGVFPEAKPADTHALLAASRLVEFSTHGVSLPFLRAFVAEHPGCAEMSTNEVSDRLIKPATRELSVVAGLRAGAGAVDAASGAPFTGVATAFVTYSGTCAFGRLVDALGRVPGSEGGGTPSAPLPFFWLYPFCLDKATSAPAQLSTAWGKQYFNHVGTFAHHVTVLDPPPAPVVLTRAWSLFEIAAAVKHKACLHMALAGEEVSVPLPDVPIVVDFLRSKASLLDDKYRILHSIDHMVGFETISAEIEAAVGSACAKQRVGGKRRK